MAIIRFLFALLLGFLVGAGTMLWLVQSGAGDFVIRRAEIVQDLERKVSALEQQRDSLTRNLENVATRMERVEGKFNDLTRRYEELNAEQEQGARRAPRDGGAEADGQR